MGKISAQDQASSVTSGQLFAVADAGNGRSVSAEQIGDYVLANHNSNFSFDGNDLTIGGDVNATNANVDNVISDSITKKTSANFEIKDTGGANLVTIAEDGTVNVLQAFGVQGASTFNGPVTANSTVNWGIYEATASNDTEFQAALDAVENGKYHEGRIFILGDFSATGFTYSKDVRIIGAQSGTARAKLTFGNGQTIVQEEDSKAEISFEAIELRVYGMSLTARYAKASFKNCLIVNPTDGFISKTNTGSTPPGGQLVIDIDGCDIIHQDGTDYFIQISRGNGGGTPLQWNYITVRNSDISGRFLLSNGQDTGSITTEVYVSDSKIDNGSSPCWRNVDTGSGTTETTVFYTDGSDVSQIDSGTVTYTKRAAWGIYTSKVSTAAEFQTAANELTNGGYHEGIIYIDSNISIVGTTIAITKKCDIVGRASNNVKPKIDIQNGGCIECQHAFKTLFSGLDISMGGASIGCIDFGGGGRRQAEFVDCKVTNTNGSPQPFPFSSTNGVSIEITARGCEFVNNDSNTAMFALILSNGTINELLDASVTFDGCQTDGYMLQVRSTGPSSSNANYDCRVYVQDTKMADTIGSGVWKRGEDQDTGATTDFEVFYTNSSDILQTEQSGSLGVTFTQTVSGGGGATTYTASVSDKTELLAAITELNTNSSYEDAIFYMTDSFTLDSTPIPEKGIRFIAQALNGSRITLTMSGSDYLVLTEGDGQFSFYNMDLVCDATSITPMIELDNSKHTLLFHSCNITDAGTSTNPMIKLSNNAIGGTKGDSPIITFKNCNVDKTAYVFAGIIETEDLVTGEILDVAVDIEGCVMDGLVCYLINGTASSKVTMNVHVTDSTIKQTTTSDGAWGLGNNDPSQEELNVNYTVSSNVNTKSQNGTVTFNQFVNTIELTASTPDFKTGKIWYDDTTKTVVCDTGYEEVRVNIGQEVQLRFYNDTGVTITNGTPINVAGVDPTSKVVMGSPADASDPLLSSAVIGLATSDVLDGEIGVATKIGELNDVDTSGLTAGGILYLGETPGALTNTRPKEPSTILILGTVTEVNATTGKILADLARFRRRSASKSYGFTSQGIGAGTFYKAGFYDFSTTDANLTQASTTVTWGDAGQAYAAHAGIIPSGPGTVDAGQVGLRVTGIEDSETGAQVAAQTGIITEDITTLTADTYFETSEKWSGNVTFELYVVSGTPTTYSLDFNYGYAKYEDFQNRDVTITGFEAVWQGNADSTLDVTLLKHSATGWTYAATAFEPGNGYIVKKSVDQSLSGNVGNGDSGAYKRTSINEFVNGNGSEGVLIEVVTGGNNTIQTMDMHISGVSEELNA